MRKVFVIAAVLTLPPRLLMRADQEEVSVVERPASRPAIRSRPTVP